jgi:tetratricopeptide (TPR) repeat protein
VARILLVLLLVGSCRLGDAPGAADGRAGNALLAEGDHQSAAGRYEAGLVATTEESPLRSRLFHNLGLARLEAEAPEQSLAAFDAAMAAAMTPEERALAAYNAGVAATLGRDLERALALFRRALLERPDFDDARYNYEVLRRFITPGPPPPPPDPSDFARELKAQADALVAERRYVDALALMIDGLEQDPSVMAYREFIDRLAGVVAIEDARWNP